MRVDLFGGSFNPPHLAHLLVAETAREEAGLDRILWMPAASPPHKPDADLAAPEHRLAMTRLAVEANPYFSVSDLELQRTGPSYTVDTVRFLTAEQPEVQFSLLIGGDSAAHFHTWYRPDVILEHVSLIIYPRPGADLTRIDPHILQRAQILSTAIYLPIAGTDIRRRCANEQSIRYQVPEVVRKYIEKQGLYRVR